MKRLNLLSLFFLVILLGFTTNQNAQDLGDDPVYGDWSGYTVIVDSQWVNSGDSMITTISKLTPRLDPGNTDWQWWNYPYHCATLAVTGADIDGDFELEAAMKMPDSTTTMNWDACLIFDYVDEYNYSMFALFRKDNSCFYKVVNGVKSQVGGIAHQTFLEQTTGNNKFHNVRIVRIGNKLSAYFDNKFVVKSVDDVLAGTGKLGVGTFNDSILVDEIKAWELPVQFSDDPVFGNYGNYDAVNMGGVRVDTAKMDTILYMPSSNPRLAPGNTDWQWWNYPYHLSNIAYIPTQTYGDFTLEADIFKPATANDNKNYDVSLVFGMESEYDYNVLWLYNKTAATKISNVSDGLRADLIFNPDSLFTDNDWHTFKVTRAGNVVTCYMDDVEILSKDSVVLGAAGMIGLGSANDPAYFDNVTVTGTPTAVSDSNTLYAITIGRLIGKQILDVFPLTGVTADMMIAAATVPAGATVTVVNDTMGLVSGSTDVENGMFLNVTAENGVDNLYEIILYVLSSDKDIELGMGELSATNDSILKIFEGTKAGILKDNISVHDSATFIIADADGVELSDDTELVTDHKVVVTAEDGHTKDYTIVVRPAPWPTVDIQKVDASNKPVIDEFFDDWTDFYGIDIDVDDDELPPPTNEADLSVQAQFVWDEDGLYVHISFTDDMINIAAIDEWKRDGIEFAILVTDDPGKRSAYNAFWKPGDRTWEQKYIYYYGMGALPAINNEGKYRDMTGCEFAWYDKDDGSGWDVEAFHTWASLNGIGTEYTFVPEIGKKISVQLMVNDADEEPDRAHQLHWWQQAGTNSDASEYAMLKLGGLVIGVNEINKSGLAIYPNPAENMLYFTGDETVERAKICNVLGQTIRTYKDIRGNSINVEELVDGVYLISVETREGRIATARFIKK
jgi:hypothetical protein